MLEMGFDKVLLVVSMSLFTALAALSDIRTRKVPNKLTIPVFLLGLVYQLVFHRWLGLADAAAGFGIGFGTLFVLWLIGGGGGGDVKLMGALGVWLGFRSTLMVMILSTAIVIVGTLGVMIYSVCVRGMSGTRSKYFADGERKGMRHPTRDSKQRRIMAYALPVALATWLVMLSVVFRAMMHT